MKTKITRLDIRDDDVKNQLLTYFREINAFKNEPMILQKDENSDKITISKPCTQEFFEKVFDQKGPFWNVYRILGLPCILENIKYVKFVCGQMYFLKNVENNMTRDCSLKKILSINNGILYEELKSDDILSYLNRYVILLKNKRNNKKIEKIVNNHIDKFEKAREEADKYYNYYCDEKNITEPIEVARVSVELAVSSMFFSNLALLSYNLRLNLKKSKAIEVCESDELEKLVIAGDIKKVKMMFGYYSLAPYDISISRFSENTKQLEKYGSFACPINYAMRWRENAKFVAARYLEIERKAMIKIGESSGLGDLIFYFSIAELEKLDLGDVRAIQIIKVVAEKRKILYEEYKNFVLPIKIIFDNGLLHKIDDRVDDIITKSVFKSLSVSSKQSVVAPVVNINSFDDYNKFKPGSVILSKNMSPNLSILIRKSKGLISESGSALSHISIIARELCVPCFVQAKINFNIKDGQYIELNGKTGDIKLIDKYLPEDNQKEEENNIQEARQLHIEINKKSGIINLEDNKDSTSHSIKSDEVIWIRELDLKNNIYGSKTTNLAILSKNYSIPNGFCVVSKTFNEILYSKKINELKSKLKENSKNIFALNEISKTLRSHIISMKFPDDLKGKLLSNYKMLSSTLLAVRSSSSLEDQDKNSFAGQFDSFLNINNFEDLLQSIKKCWASFFNTRSIIYRLENDINDNDVRMSVLVQQMIEAEYSGVLFTNNIDNSNTILCEVVPGMCENLVLGKITPNTYVLNRKNVLIFQKKEEFKFDEQVIKKISAIGLEIEKTLLYPVDIEWCIDKDMKIWILQARPITALKNKCSIEI
ncbi:hypothetical protein K0B03_03125 [Patescibacteria group bacterium]|nr:hypothetical protein [Patescibacteria group bacterium]